MIAIPNMEMPKSCWDCDLISSCKAMPKNPTADEIGIYTIMRLNDCPLIDIVTCGECKFWESAKNGWNGYCNKKVDAFNTFYKTDWCSFGQRRSE